MTTDTTRELLKQINKDWQPSITGCQIHYQEAAEYALAAESQCTNEQGKLAIIEEMIAQRRELLESWRRTPHCSRTRVKCRKGLCDCSYSDLACYASLLKLRHTQRIKVQHLQSQASNFRIIVRSIIQPRFQAMLDNIYCAQAFIGASYLTGELDENEYWLAMFYSSSKPLTGSLFELCLTVGLEPTRVIRWDQFGKRVA